jgi:uncharacterized membrane protein YhaH (DUF805 family)
MNYMLMPLRRYADFSGRSRRLEFWLWTLLNWIIQGVLWALILGSFFTTLASIAERARNGEFDSYAATADGSTTVTLNGETYNVPPEVAMEAFSGIFGLPFVIACLWGLITFIPNLAVAVRRLHDTDRSGWSLLFGLIPLIGAIILLVFFLSPGTPGPNRYGPDPKAATPGPQFA